MQNATHTAIIIEIYINLIKILINAFTVKLILWHAVIQGNSEKCTGAFKCGYTFSNQSVHYVRSEI